MCLCSRFEIIKKKKKGKKNSYKYEKKRNLKKKKKPRVSVIYIYMLDEENLKGHEKKNPNTYYLFVSLLITASPLIAKNKERLWGMGGARLFTTNGVFADFGI